MNSGSLQALAGCQHVKARLKSKLISMGCMTSDTGLKFECPKGCVISGFTHYRWFCKLSSCRTSEWISSAPTTGVGPMTVATILILPIQEHGISFHFFEFSLISFFNVLLLSVHNPFTSLVRFIPRLFSYLEGVVLKAFFLHFFPDISLWVLKNASDFCMC